jgi:hypothetical protein
MIYHIERVNFIPYTDSLGLSLRQKSQQSEPN